MKNKNVVLNKPERHWSQPPPGTEIQINGKVQQGDWFYIEQLGAWGNVPPSAIGEDIETCGQLVARGTISPEQVYFAAVANHVYGKQ